MSVGLPVTKSEIDSRSGDIARTFQKSFEDVFTMQGYLEQTPNADLIALGYTDAEVAQLKTAFADLTELGSIWTGGPGTVPKDYRTFVRLLWGVGAF
jgi:monomeric isocitrate dehydrogenase